MQAKYAQNANSIKMALAEKIESAAYNSWIAPCSFEISGNVLSVCAHNQFSADYINSVYLGELQSFGMPVSVCVGGAAATVSKTANDNNIQKFIPVDVAAASVNFSDFVVCDENAFVVSACKKMAVGNATFSPLFIYGASGCGKTTLCECINGAAAGRTIMMTGASFVSEFLRAIRENSVFAFKDFCRNCDTFILDGIDDIAGKRATCDEFMQLIIDLKTANKNIVLTSNVAPGALAGFDRRMQSIMASGLVSDICAPTLSVKKQMLVRAGVAQNIADALVGRINGDGHLIAGVAKKIQTYAQLMNEIVTAPIAEKLLADTLGKSKTPSVMVKDMCSVLGVSYDSVCGAGRTKSLVRCRQVMMLALKRTTTLSLSEIGMYVGGRDHATVLYAISQMEKLMMDDLILGAQINEMMEVCR